MKFQQYMIERIAELSTKSGSIWFVGAMFLFLEADTLKDYILTIVMVLAGLINMLLPDKAGEDK